MRGSSGDDLHISRFGREKNQTIMIVITGDDGGGGETGSNVEMVPFLPRQRVSKFFPEISENGKVVGSIPDPQT